jgi:hypothetical protein
MTSTDIHPTVPLHDNGSEVLFEKSDSNTKVHTLWQPKPNGELRAEPLWHLRVNVLKDGDVRGDCPSRSFVRTSNVSPTTFLGFLTVR